MNKKIKVGAVQMESTIGDYEANIEKARNYIENNFDLDIIAFPELFTTGYALKTIGNKYYDFAETIPGQTTEYFSGLADKYDTVIIGNIVEKEKKVEEILYDTTFIINKEGELIGKYRKVHVHPSETMLFARGSVFPVFEVGDVNIGLATCYDHGFGEMFRIMARKGAQIIFIPSGVPKGYEYLLNLRTRARAQDNQLFTVAVNSTGEADGKVFCGKSMVVNPRGEVVKSLGDKEEVLKVEMDLSLIKPERQQEPLIRDARYDLYSREYKGF